MLEFQYHQGRVGTMAWMKEPNCLLSGGKDSNIFSYDLRSNRRTAKYKYHNQ